MSHTKAKQPVGLWWELLKNKWRWKNCRRRKTHVCWEGLCWFYKGVAHGIEIAVEVERRRAAAVESEKAPIVDRTAFAAAPGSGALMWSAEKPKRRGWWWWMRRDCEEPLVLPINGHLMVEHPYGWMTLENMELRFPGQRWAGPLVEPEEASDAEPLPNDPSSETAL